MSARRVQSQKRQLLFLDFDGTLHPYGCNPSRYLERLPLLEEWMRARPSLDVVISSDWRHHHPRAELIRLFSVDLRSRVIGVTGHVMDWSGNVDWPIGPRGARPGYIPGARELEIWHWLAENDLKQCDWRALDDMAWLFSKDCTELVEVEGTTGITADTLAELDGWLRSIGGAR